MSNTPNPARQLFGSSPCFLVADIHKAVDYYRDVLGFTTEQIWGEPPSFAIPTRDNLSVMLKQVTESLVRPNAHVVNEVFDAYFWVRDAEALFEDFRGKGATVLFEPTIRQLYGMKEFAVADADGYLLAFGQDWPGD